MSEGRERTDLAHPRHDTVSEHTDVIGAIEQAVACRRPPRCSRTERRYSSVESMKRLLTPLAPASAPELLMVMA